jgi:hypothetical protein
MGARPAGCDAPTLDEDGDGRAGCLGSPDQLGSGWCVGKD